MYILASNIKLPISRITEIYFYADKAYELMCESKEIGSLDEFINLFKPLETISNFTIEVFNDEDVLEASYHEYSIERIEYGITDNEHNTIITFKK